MTTRPRLVDSAAAIFFRGILVAGVIVGAVLDVPPLLSPAQMKVLATEPPVVIKVRDLQAATGWYEDKLGFTRVASAPEASNEPVSKVVLLSARSRVELIQRGSSSDIASFISRRHRVPLLERKAVELRVDDIDSTTDELRAAGVVVVEGPRFTTNRVGLRVSRIYDFEGQVIEIQQLL